MGDKIYKIKRFLEFWHINETIRSKIEIPQSIIDIHRLFNRSGHQLFLVGGCVRDFLKGDTPKDFDLCTDALPDEILGIIGSEYKTNLQGASFGVVVVYTDDQPMGMEIATFRSDTYDGKSRNPKVEYTTIENDVLRRDLSINSLFYDLDKKEIVDLVGGISDLENKIIRMVGDPEKRIEEDPLRILRCIRFSYRYGYNIDEETSEDIKKTKKSLQRIVKERIWEEIKKAYGYKKNFKDYLQIVTDLGLLEEIFPNLKINSNIQESNYLPVYIANILKDNDPQKLERTLVLSLKIESDVSSKACHLIRLLNLSPENAFLMYKDRIKCHVTNEMISEWSKINNLDQDLFNAFIEYSPSVSAEDLMRHGIKGKDLGNEIKRLETEEFKRILGGSINESSINDYYNFIDCVDSFMDDFPKLKYKIDTVRKEGSMKTVLYPFLKDINNYDTIEITISDSKESQSFIDDKLLKNRIVYKMPQSKKVSGLNFDVADNISYQSQYDKIVSHPLISTISTRTNYFLIYASNIDDPIFVFQRMR